MKKNYQTLGGDAPVTTDVTQQDKDLFEAYKKALQDYVSFTKGRYWLVFTREIDAGGFPSTPDTGLHRLCRGYLFKHLFNVVSISQKILQRTEEWRLPLWWLPLFVKKEWSALRYLIPAVFAFAGAVVFGGLASNSYYYFAAGSAFMFGMGLMFEPLKKLLDGMIECAWLPVRAPAKWIQFLSISLSLVASYFSSDSLSSYARSITWFPEWAITWLITPAKIGTIAQPFRDVFDSIWQNVLPNLRPGAIVDERRLLAKQLLDEHILRASEERSILALPNQDARAYQIIRHALSSNVNYKGYQRNLVKGVSILFVLVCFVACVLPVSKLIYLEAGLDTLHRYGSIIGVLLFMLRAAWLVFPDVATKFWHSLFPATLHKTWILFNTMFAGLAYGLATQSIINVARATFTHEALPPGMRPVPHQQDFQGAGLILFLVLVGIGVGTKNMMFLLTQSLDYLSRRYMQKQEAELPRQKGDGTRLSSEQMQYRAHYAAIGYKAHRAFLATKTLQDQMLLMYTFIHTENFYVALALNNRFIKMFGYDVLTTLKFLSRSHAATDGTSEQPEQNAYDFVSQQGHTQGAHVLRFAIAVTAATLTSLTVYTSSSLALTLFALLAIPAMALTSTLKLQRHTSSHTRYSSFFSMDEEQGILTTPSPTQLLIEKINTFLKAATKECSPIVMYALTKWVAQHATHYLFELDETSSAHYTSLAEASVVGATTYLAFRH